MRCVDVISTHLFREVLFYNFLFKDPTMRGYVINLDRQPERLTHFYQQLGSEIFQKVSAVDRKVLDIIGNKEFFFDVATFTRMIPRGPTMGEIACTLSHIKCWQLIALDESIDEDEFCLIAEDDITLLPSNKNTPSKFLDVVSDISKALEDTPVELVKLQMLSYRESNLFTGNGNISLSKSIATGFDASYDNTGSSLYLIRKSLTQTIMHKLKTKKPYWLADGFTKFCNPENIMMSLPLLGYVKGNLSSDLEEERFQQIQTHIQNT